MFYENNPDDALRFGDVVNGFVLSSTDIDDPESFTDYKINVDIPDFCVILTPCCSIGRKVILLSPLEKIRSSFFDNPYFLEDLTRINREMDPKQSVSSEVWDRFGLEEQQKRLAEGRRFALNDVFIYEPNNYFNDYIIDRKKENIQTNYYMIDFKNTYKINCKKIISPESSPLNIKCMQLSIKTREELRKKLSEYYRRIPEEDKIKID
jgi:hypothetical protein